MLEAGMLRLEPLNFGVAGGDIRSTIRMDARESTHHARAPTSHARSLNLAKLLPTVNSTKDAIGQVGGEIDIAGTRQLDRAHARQRRWQRRCSAWAAARSATC